MDATLSYLTGLLLVPLGVAMFFGGMQDIVSASHQTKSGVPHPIDTNPIPESFLTARGSRAQRRGYLFAVLGLIVLLIGWYLMSK